jgi:parallel beta helix pectate lyase-like protein
VKHARFSVVVLAILFVSLPAYAQIQRTFVSADVGNDANPCTRPLPCRNFAAAMLQTRPDGQVVALDSGGYGPFTVSIPVSIEAPAGVFAGVTVFAGNGVNVSAGLSDTVSLRGLTINGLGGTNGILFQAGSALHIERCAVSHMSNIGIVDVNAGTLFVKDTTVSSCNHGIQTGNGSQIVRGVIDHSFVEGPGNIGLGAYQGSRTTVRNSVIVGNGGGIGVFARSSSPGLSTDLTVENCSISGFATGVSSTVTGGGTLSARVSNSTITHNTTAVSSSDPVNAPIRSRLNNTLEGNTNNGTFTGSFPAN